VPLSDPEQRRKRLTFAIVGGGPTGVEFAGALAELLRRPLRKDYTKLGLRDSADRHGHPSLPTDY